LLSALGIYYFKNRINGLLLFFLATTSASIAFQVSSEIQDMNLSVDVFGLSSATI
jgi:hypothetical protein